MLSPIFTPSVKKEESIHTEQVLQFLIEPVKNEQGTLSHLQSLFREQTIHSSRSKFLSSESQTFPTLYTRTHSQDQGQGLPLSLHSHQVSLMPSEAPSFQMHACSESLDPNDLLIHLYAHNSQWNPEILAHCLLTVVFVYWVQPDTCCIHGMLKGEMPNIDPLCVWLWSLCLPPSHG